MLTLLAILPMLLVGSSGLLVNIYLFVKFFSKTPESSGEFNKLCHAKTIPNILVCTAFLFWSVPLTTLHLSLEQVPVFPNVLLGQIGITGPYVARPVIQMFMGINIWFAVYFPLRKLQVKVRWLTNTALIVLFLLTLGYMIRNMMPCELLERITKLDWELVVDCGAYFDPHLLIWTSVSECSFELYNITAVIVVVFSVISNVFTTTTLIKLCYDRVGGLSHGSMNVRRKRRVRLFLQSLLQDCLHVIDVINWKFVTMLSSEIWFQFVFSSMSLLLIHALDGFVMLYFHSELHPKFLKKRSMRTSTQINITLSHT